MSARETWLRVNLWKAIYITMGFVLLVLWSTLAFYAQRLLSIFVFVPHATLTVLGLCFPKAWGGLLRPTAARYPMVRPGPLLAMTFPLRWQLLRA